jgi:hypothetical protein
MAEVKKQDRAIKEKRKMEKETAVIIFLASKTILPAGFSSSALSPILKIKKERKQERKNNKKEEM